MKKVLIIGMTSGVGGVETFVSNLLDRIDKNRFKVDLLLFQSINEKYEETLQNANNVYYINAINKKPLKYIVDIMKFYRHHSYDIIHINECTAKLFVYCWPASFMNNTKIIIHSHNGNGDKGIAHSFLNKCQNMVADERWSCSTEASRWMFGKISPYKKKLIKSVNNGVDINKYSFSDTIRNSYRKRLHIDPETTVIGSVARFETQKNHTLIIDVFEEYLKRHSNSLLVLVGDGSLRKEIMEKVSNLGIQEKVLFLGNRNDVPKLLQMFDTILMPSLYEGLPFIGLEAQAAGLPVIASNTVDKELKITSLVRFLKLNSSVTEWSNAIDNAIQNNDRIQTRNSIKERFVEAKYDVDTTVKYIEDLYEKI